MARAKVQARMRLWIIISSVGLIGLQHLLILLLQWMDLLVFNDVDCPKWL